MIRMYCSAHHQRGKTLCQECNALLEYATRRLEKCPFGENKPVCQRCPVHCYTKEKRAHVRRVMRFAGPRMIWHHPLLTVRHVIDDVVRRRQARGAGMDLE